MTLTPERLAELRALCSAATLGPWHVEGRNVWSGDWRTDGIQSLVCTYWAEDLHPMDAPPLGTGATMAFIAAARTALPEALDEIERLRGLLERSRVSMVRVPARTEKDWRERLPLLADIDAALKGET